MWTVQIIIRVAQVLLWSTVAFWRLVLRMPLVLLRGGDVPRRRRAGALVANVGRRWLQDLGATFIKVGQILSTRPDILPDHAIAELALLQDQVPPFPFRHVVHTIETELGRPVEQIFTRLDPTPIASASVAQVHVGLLPTGEEVAVKVRRPNIVRKAELDETIMKLFARLVSVIPTVHFLSPVESVSEFCAAIRDQLDLRKEAANNRRFQANFEGMADVRFPALYDALCTPSILTMEYIRGVKEDRLDTIDADPRKLARIGSRAVLHMIFRHGFVHADLHPGNILFEPGNRVCFIDLGMVGRVDPERRRALAQLFFALAANDGATVARVMYEQSPHKAVTDYDAYEKDVQGFIATFYAKRLGDVEVSLLIGNVFRIIRRHRIRAEAAFTVINIAFIVMEGLGKKLDPTMDLFGETMPFLGELLAEKAQQGQESAAPSGDRSAP